SRESKNPLRAEEINEITQFTANLPKSIDVKWGIGDNPEMGDNVKVTILASGFDVTLREKEKGEEIVFKSEPEEKAATEQRNAAGKQQMEEVYGTEKLTKQLRDAAKIKYAVLLPSQFDDHEVIAMLERTPTYNRDPRFNEELARISQPGAAPRAEINPETPRANSDSSNRISY
ncbi:MAG: hypothetical protein K2G75_06395, partial [Muribaculaceae bacterium]|nr:hypothetical protein [Muribaculaceae bacterium]